MDIKEALFEDLLEEMRSRTVGIVIAYHLKDHDRDVDYGCKASGPVMLLRGLGAYANDHCRELTDG